MPDFSCRIADAKLFQALIEAVSVVITEGNILVTENVLAMRSMDPARVALVDFELPKDAFVDYSYSEELRIGISMDEVKEIMKRSKRGEAVEITYEVEKGRLVFRLLGPPERRFSISTLDLEGEETPMPSLEFDTRIKLGSEMLSELVKDAEVVSDHIELHSDPEILKAKATSDTREVEVKITKEDREHVTEFEVKNESRAVYTLRYLKDMARAARMADEVSIEFSKDMPLRLDFEIPAGENDVKGRLTYFLAPRIEEG